MKTINEVINFFKQNYDLNDDWMIDILYYLYDYKRLKEEKFPIKEEDIITYKGTKPIILLNDEFYLVRKYCRDSKSWLLEKQNCNESGVWYNCDDYNYYFDKNGKLIEKLL